MKKIGISLPISILKEGGAFIAYYPALDISTSALSFEKVHERFEKLVEIFFEETTKHGTLNEALADLGWKKSNTRWNPPIVVAKVTIGFTGDKD